MERRGAYLRTFKIFFMSEEQLNLILKLIENHDKKHGAQIKGYQKNIEAGFEAFNVKLDAIKDNMKAESDAVQGNREMIKDIKKDTIAWRWMHRNPKLTFIILGVFFTGIIAVLGYLNKGQAENIIKGLIGF